MTKYRHMLFSRTLGATAKLHLMTGAMRRYERVDVDGRRLRTLYCKHVSRLGVFERIVRCMDVQRMNRISLMATSGSTPAASTREVPLS